MVVQSLKELWKEFKWLEFCPSRLHYDWMMTYSEMIRERDKEHYKGREMFISRYAYDRDNPYSGPLLSNLYFDFDDEKNPNRAKADCLSAAEYFNETYKIPFETMKIRFTGGKGFSLEIPFQFYNVKPTKHLNKIWKKIAVRVKTINQLKTCDENVYDRRRLWRLTNSRHRSGCYKIPLTYHELKSMAIREIKNLARKGPRKYLYISDMKRDYKPVPALENWFKEIQDEVLKEWNEQIERIIEKLGKETPIPKDFDQKKIWYCVQQRIQKGVNINEGKFRREPTAFNIAVALHRLGASDDYIRSRLEEFAKSCIPEFPNERYKDFDQILNMVHAHEYSTHCFTPCFAELCDKSQCWLFKEAETTLENIDFEEDVKLKVIDGAGGFNEDFIYETFSVMSQYGEICWILVWFDGKEAGMEIIADENKVREFIEIKGETSKVWNVPCLYLETLWGKKSAYEFVQTKKIPKPQDVYERVESIVRFFADCDDGTEAVDGRYVFGACWSIATYWYELFHFFPYNLARGFMLSGKTTWMLACVYQAYHGHGPITNPSPASIFRTIETTKPTLALDNAERLYDSKQMDEENKKIVEMLDVGAYAGGKVPRVEGKSETGYVVKEWKVYCPKAITTVKGVAPSLVSRSVPMDMIQTDDPKYGDRRGELWPNPRDGFDVKAAEIVANRNDLYKLRMKFWKRIIDVSRSLKSEDFGVKSRDWDLWKPIFTIAKIFCPDKISALMNYVEETKAVMEELQASAEKEGMLRVLINVYQKDGWYALKGLAELFKEQMEWKKCSSQRASQILKNLGFKKRKRAGPEGLTHVFINRKILDRQSKAIGLHRRSEDQSPSGDGKTDFGKMEKNSWPVVEFDYHSSGSSNFRPSEETVDFDEAFGGKKKDDPNS